MYWNVLLVCTSTILTQPNSRPPSFQARAASTQASASSAATPFLASRGALVGASAFAATSLSFYGYQYGSLPFVDQLQANMVDEGLHPPKYPWSHSGIFNTFDHSS